MVVSIDTHIETPGDLFLRRRCFGIRSQSFLDQHTLLLKRAYRPALRIKTPQPVHHGTRDALLTECFELGLSFRVIRFDRFDEPVEGGAANLVIRDLRRQLPRKTRGVGMNQMAVVHDDRVAQIDGPR